METSSAGVLRSDLRNSYLDAISWGLMVGLGESAFQVFALAAGASEIESALVATVPLMAGALIQLAAPWGVERMGSHRKWIVVNVFLQAVSLTALAALAYLGWMPIWAVFLLMSLYWGFGMVAGPAWITWMGTLIPPRIRAGYFSRRSQGTQAAILIGLLGSAAAQRYLGPVLGRPLHAFALMFLLAGIFRFLCCLFLSRQSEPEPIPPGHRRVPMGTIAGRLGRGGAGKFLLYIFLTQVAVQVAAPYFAPYLKHELKYSDAQILFLTGIPSPRGSLRCRSGKWPASTALASALDREGSGSSRSRRSGFPGIRSAGSSFCTLTGAVWAAHSWRWGFCSSKNFGADQPDDLLLPGVIAMTAGSFLGSLCFGWSARG